MGVGRFLGCAFELPLPVAPPWPTLFLGCPEESHLSLTRLLLGHFACLRPNAVQQPTLGPNLKLEPKKIKCFFFQGVFPRGL